jgi:hypothetical protein
MAQYSQVWAVGRIMGTGIHLSKVRDRICRDSPWADLTRSIHVGLVLDCYAIEVKTRVGSGVVYHCRRQQSSARAFNFCRVPLLPTINNLVIIFFKHANVSIAGAFRSSRWFRLKTKVLNYNMYWNIKCLPFNPTAACQPQMGYQIIPIRNEWKSSFGVSHHKSRQK